MAKTNSSKAREKFHAVIVSPDKVLYEGSEVVRLMAPGKVQEIAILPDHTPLYSELVKGEVIILDSNDSTDRVPIESGIIRVKNNRVSIIIGF